jgi:preprotein translocase subunit SecD
MLQFPVWKICLILGIMLWGILMALPNVVNMSGTPAGVPKQGVNLGLDLQGGVYLMMEINPDEVVANRLEVFAIDVRNTLGNKDGKTLIGHLPTLDGRTLNINLTRPDAEGNFPMDRRSPAFAS